MSPVEGTSAPGKDDARVHRAFGLDFACGFEMPGIPVEDAVPASLEIALAPSAEVDAAWGGPLAQPAVVETSLDGVAYRAERGTAGDHRFSYGDRARFHLSSDTRTLICAPADPEAPEWRRVLLDSVLATVCLLRGFEALHAAAVLGPAGVVAFMGHTGGGKTTLAAELLRRGMPLVCDDVLALSRDGDRIVAHPGPPVMNLPAGAPQPAGTSLATIRGETWIAVDGCARDAGPVAAVCVIDRRPGLDTALVPGPAGPLDLLAHGLRSGTGADRRQARFELFADLAMQAQAYVLEADTRAGAAELADLVQSGVPALAPAHAGAAR